MILVILVSVLVSFGQSTCNCQPKSFQC